ncbi:hypothetical protein [Deinococcus frigens]|uniref:hypothetical protein n=1 Tax=Deinococcus frigens TaxID=249403 RepID=UPI000ACB5AC6|nr:hypothetical protein [Deinococcus frigens]
MSRRFPDLCTKQTEPVLRAAQNALAGAQQEIQVLSAYTALAQAAATTSDLKTLARRAQEVLQASIPQLQVAFYRRVGGRWVAQVTTNGLLGDLLGMIRRGLPLTTPAFAQTVRAAGPTFFDRWDAGQQQMPFTELFGAVGLAPFFRDGQPSAMLTVGFGGAEVWSAQQRQLFTSVYAAIHSTQQRDIQSDFHERQLGLEAFVQLTEAIGVGTDRLEAAQRAHDLLRELFPHWSFGYYELRAGCGRRCWPTSPIQCCASRCSRGCRNLLSVIRRQWRRAGQSFLTSGTPGRSSLTTPSPTAQRPFTRICAGESPSPCS